MELPKIEVMQSWYAKKENLFLFSIFCLFTFIAELLLLFAGFKSYLNPWSIAISHGFLSLSSFFLLGFYVKLQYDIRFPLLHVILLTLMGPIGAGMTLLVLVLYFLESTFRPDAGKALLEILYPPFELSKTAFLYNRITYGMEDTQIKEGTTSYQDIMSFGTILQKRRALEKIGRYFLPEFVPVLEMALNDTNNSIRVYAGTILTRLEAQFYNQFLQLEELIKTQPDNSRYILAYANHCEKYFESKILAKDRAEKMRQLAIEAFLKCLTFAPKENFEILLSLARLYLSGGQYGKSEFYIQQLFQEHKKVPAEAYLILMKLNYEQKKYNMLRDFSKREIPLEIEDPNADQLRELMTFWNRN